MFDIHTIKLVYYFSKYMLNLCIIMSSSYKVDFIYSGYKNIQIWGSFKIYAYSFH